MPYIGLGGYPQNYAAIQVIIQGQTGLAVDLSFCLVNPVKPLHFEAKKSLIWIL